MTRAVRIPLPGSPQGPDEEADVRALYLRLLVEARGAGFPKRAGETPLEYLATLERNLPAERVALERLTKDYVVVRYGEQEISEEETGLLNRLWRNIYERIHYGDESQAHAGAVIGRPAHGGGRGSRARKKRGSIAPPFEFRAQGRCYWPSPSRLVWSSH